MKKTKKEVKEGKRFSLDQREKQDKHLQVRYLKCKRCRPPHHTEAEFLISNDVSHVGLQILWTFSVVFCLWCFFVCFRSDLRKVTPCVHLIIFFSS